MPSFIFLMSAEDLCDSKLYEKAYRTLSPYRRQKTDRYRFCEDRRLSVAAEQLLKYALKNVGVIFDGEFNFSENGKPYLKNSNIYFNLSHSGSYVLCAVSDSEIGCDIEKIHPVNPKTAERFFCESEYKAVNSVKDTQKQTELFIRYWVLKESFIKLTGLGMKQPLNSFQIILSKNITVKQSVLPKNCYFKEFGELKGYRIAVCSLADCSELKLKTVKLSETLQTE